MTDSLVLELQRDALDHSSPSSSLLRKALVASRKLGAHDLQSWIESELNGYTDNSVIPAYRTIRGVLKAWNPYRGWIPVTINDAEMDHLVTNIAIDQSVGSIEHLLSRADGDGYITIPFTSSQEALLARLFDSPFHVTRHIDGSQLFSIVDAVRTTILNWALKLESDGIMGDGLSFSQRERDVAAAANYNVFNITGDATGIQLQQSSPGATQAQITIDLKELEALLPLLERAITELELGDRDRADLRVATSTIREQLKSSRPSKSAIARETLRSVRSIVEGITGNLLAAEILRQIAILLGTG